MPYVEIYNGVAEANEILQSLKDDGLVGISGGRVQVREKLREVANLIEEENIEEYHANSTINHPDTELGYAYDSERFTLNKAQTDVTQAYESKKV